MTTGQLQIHSENILPIIKRWLYSDKDIFIRELVSNACDAMQKVKILREQGETSAKDTEFRIDVRVDKEAKTITFADTGLGMSADEVEKYIAQIAFSGAEDFVERFEGKGDEEQIIGHFGLGFYSSYMVADTVEIDTLSYRDGAEAARWSCDGSPEYTLDKGTRTERGSTITLHVGADSEDFLEEAQIREILTKYCRFLPYPIFLNDEQINPKEPLWVKPASECTREDYIEFFRTLYPFEAEPLFWIHLNVDYPFHLKGILYFPKATRDYDTNKRGIDLYCNRVFVSDNCKDVVPDFLLALKGVIDSPDIPLNVSRSSLQMDRTVRQVASHISKKVADSLSSLYKTDRERYVDCWPFVEIVTKLGALEDEKFCGRVKDIMIWKNDANEWTTVPDYLERNTERTDGKIFYSYDGKGSAQFLQMYRDRNVEVLHANPVIDTMFLGFFEEKLENGKFQRIDGAIDDAIVDKDRERTVLDADGRTEGAKLADLVRSRLDIEDAEVEAKSLSNDALPGFVMIDENTRRYRDAMRRMAGDGQSGAGGVGKHTFVLNTNNALVNTLPALDARDPELSKEVVSALYQLSLLSQRELNPDELDSFIERTTGVIERLAKPSEK